MLKKCMLLFSWFLLFFSVPVFSDILPEYKGVKPSPSETEAQLQDPLLCEKGCERQINVQRDRDPHGMSPQEVHNLVKRIVQKSKPPTTPTDGDGSR